MFCSRDFSSIPYIKTTYSHNEIHSLTPDLPLTRPLTASKVNIIALNDV